MNLTILTPTFNRGYILSRLYKSLVNQSNINFEWLIVDDGSTDNTNEIVDGFIYENKISIRYFKTQNGGKHRALNYGIGKIESPLTFIVDSDDYLKENAVDVILHYYSEYMHDSSICGFSFLRCFPNGDINGKMYESSPYISDYISCRLNENICGDKAEVYLTKCLKEFPFLEVEGEKFLFEDYVWIQLAEKYKTVHLNIAIYVGDYLIDGLTNKIDKLKVNNPIGMMYRAKVFYSKKCNLKNKAKAMMQYIAFGKLAKLTTADLLYQSNNKLFFLSVFIPALLYYTKLQRLKVEL
ncbi:glycosyltransferase family 2 protein [Butyrivibrio sp. JL13D10]|uniref:glycosyltransferase family 2 protein n=1 Tax=Butyrivibrio sp. JL13D10 TaxID=3236815 RepID=UPI0038B4CD1F